jgi:hypothetical protein
MKATRSNSAEHISLVIRVLNELKRGHSLEDVCRFFQKSEDDLETLVLEHLVSVFDSGERGNLTIQECEEIYHVDYEKFLIALFELANYRNNLDPVDENHLSERQVEEVYGIARSTFRKMKQRKADQIELRPHGGRRGIVIN